MSRKLVLTTFFLTVLIGTLGLSFEVQTVEASGTIYIRADGSIDPPTAPISTVDNITYILTGNVTSDGDGIVVERNDVTIDGVGHAIQGTGVFPYRGIDLTEKSNVTIKSINVRAFWIGININSSSENSISENYIIGTTTADGLGIKLGGFSSNNTIYGNAVTNIEWGIELGRSSNNNVTGNNMTNCWGGIKLGDSSNNTLTRNKMANNQIGIEFMNSSDNTIYSNNFVDNIARQAYIYSYVSNNVWDNSYPSGGNYWSNYTGVDANHDGIGDTPYIIDANNTDHYPLMTSYIIPEFPSFLILPLLFIATLLALIIYRRKNPQNE